MTNQERVAFIEAMKRQWAEEHRLDVKVERNLPDLNVDLDMSNAFYETGYMMLGSADCYCSKFTRQDY